MHAARGSEFAILKRLHAHADAIESGFEPGRRAFRRHGFGIGFERCFTPPRMECATKPRPSFQPVLRRKKTWRAAADVYGVHLNLRMRLIAPPGDSAFRVKLRVICQFAADGACVRRMQSLREDSRVKIAVGTLRLAERNLDVEAVLDRVVQCFSQKNSTDTFLLQRLSWTPGSTSLLRC